MQHQTARRQIVADKIATAVIASVGVGVLFTVLAILAFLVRSAWPLWMPERLEKAQSVGFLSGQTFLEDNGFPLALGLVDEAGCRFELRNLSEGRAVASFGLSRAADGALVLAKTSDPALRCRGTGGAFVAVFDAANAETFSHAALVLDRQFLMGDELSDVDAKATATLNRSHLLVRGDEVLARASPSAPIARLRPGLRLADTLPLPNALGFEALANHGLEVLSQDDAHNVLLVREPATGRVAWASTFVRQTNALTGAIQSEATVVALPPEVRQVAWSAAGPLLLFLANGEVEYRLPEAQGRMPLMGFAAVRHVVPMVGGSAFFVDSGNGHCGFFDSSRLLRPGSSPMLWSDACLPEALVAAHPQKRIVAQVGPEAVWAFETTTGRRMFRTTLEKLDVQGQISQLGFSSTGGQLLLGSGRESWAATLVAPHPEASWLAFFGRVFYEGYEKEGYTWQSTSGAEGFQAKFSLMPLIWGTLKACFYAMIFAVPMGVFAAIYSSELLNRSTRNVVKPAIEMMASLPSVVLGFLAAIVIAPWIERNVLGAVLCIVGLPFVLFFVGNVASSYSAKHISARGLFAANRLLFVYGVASLLSLVGLLELGDLIERSAFGGDVKNYLAGGHGVEGVLWGILLLPLTWMGLWSLRAGRFQKSWRSIVFLMAPLVALGIGILLASQGDIRSNFLGTYSQRNTLVIALCMGFAVIPIIYSISEDALCSVPASLRAASLACGASVWQTTARVVVPTAASGIFSACIIGLGRAIGETMIVVMATGNTPVMSLNPFEGLRSLSANIAVEMPEAVQGSTHYRTLFFSALILFGFTFVLNSLAEWIRSRYRARSKAL